jgi:hypothetical protein
MGIFLEGEDSCSDHGLGRLVAFRFKTAMPRREDHEVHKDTWWHWIYYLKINK